MSKEQILKDFELFSLNIGGIGSWITETTNEIIFNRIDQIESSPLKKVQLNQLLVLGHEAPLSDGFFKYYWLSASPDHPYEIIKIVDFKNEWIQYDSISSIKHLIWGLYRLYLDSTLYFGNVRTGYRYLRSLSENNIIDFFKQKRIDTNLMKTRGPALPLEKIAKDDRYLISEMACKSYGDEFLSTGNLKDALIKSYEEMASKGNTKILIKDLISGEFIKNNYNSNQLEFNFSLDSVLDESINSMDELLNKYNKIESTFKKTRKLALSNTENYLSMVSELDVYVATSMRTRKDFRDMANKAEEIFNDPLVKDLELRYFDPTLSAAAGHEDKGLIECLMVKCAKVLIYFAGEKESYGKDAEAAMALSLGKPVIFLCDEEQKKRFYRDIHPLARLIQFETGIAVGAIVTDNTKEVSILLNRIFNNTMEYELEKSEAGYLRVKEKLTGSIVRLQTNNRLLSETFWNHYHA